MSDLESLPPRYPDEMWEVDIDWATALEGDEVVGTPTAVPMGAAFTVDQVAQVGTKTLFRVSGGGGRSIAARIAFLATTSNGEKLGHTLDAPIRAR